MAKKGSQKKDGSSRSGKRKTRGEYVDPQNMDDDIDSFHKQRDIIPLDVDADVDADVDTEVVCYDDVVDGEKGNRRLSDGHTSSLGSKKLSKLVISKQNKPKVVSGDDDLPTRDDIGERRRKHELRVLADAGIRTEDDAGIESDKNDDMEEDADSSENDLYEQVKQKQAAKLAAKAEIYTRTSALPSLPETADGKRHITYQIEKNRGLTRPRNKLTKNPRKKYRTKHDKAQKRRLGQVRQIKKPSGPYGGESSGINARISRSIRL